jgi:CheY-like chemotaxis protein
MPKKWAPRLLVCTIPEMLATAHEILGERYNCEFSLSLNDACAHLNTKPDAIVCNLHFDEGRMFEFLAYVRAHPGTCDVPFVVLQTRKSLTPGTIKGIQAASRAFGIDAFVEVFRVREDHGHDASVAEVRETIDRVLAAKQKVPLSDEDE